MHTHTHMQYGHKNLHACMDTHIYAHAHTHIYRTLNRLAGSPTHHGASPDPAKQGTLSNQFISFEFTVDRKT